MDNLTITTNNGKLRGKKSIDYMGKSFYSFQGIPYAKPPLGKLRFKSPQSPKSWTGVLDATKDGNVSLSMENDMLRGNEDCLYLNVYTPNIPIDSNEILKPVMVYIHGGGYTFGSGCKSDFGPEFLVHEDIILVTFNYRLGFMGFVHFNDPSLGVHGNAGLKDMILALQWVQANIIHFGGDPKNVTIFGNSAGAASVHILLLSDRAKGLFHKAIAQSGNAGCDWAFSKKDKTKLMASLLGCDSNDDKTVYEFLMNCSAEKITEMSVQGNKDERDHMLSMPIAPIIESSYSPDAIIREDPIEIIRSGKFIQVPVIFGSNDREGYLLVDDHSYFEVDINNKHIEKYIPNRWNIRDDSKEEVGELIKKFYFVDEEPNELNGQIMYKLVGDMCTIVESIEFAHEHAKYAKAPVYYYQFSFNGNRNISKKMKGVTYEGAAHADELGYLFTNDILHEELSAADIKTIQIMTRIWTTFARTGKSDLKVIGSDLKWEPLQKDKFQYLDIGKIVSFQVGLPRQEEMLLFNEIRSKYSGPL